MSESKPLTGEWSRKRKEIFYFTAAVIIIPLSIVDLVRHKGITVLGVMALFLGVCWFIRAMQLKRRTQP